MSVICIEENWVIESLAQAGDNGGNLAYAQKAALAFGRADENRRFQLARSLHHSLEGDEVRDIEVADRDLPTSSVLQYIAERHHVSSALFAAHKSPGDAFCNVRPNARVGTRFIWRHSTFTMH